MVERSEVYPGGQVWELDIGVARIEHRFGPAGHMHYRILSGEFAGDEETVAIDVRALGHGLYLLAWREAKGNTVVHVEDLSQGTVHAYLTLPGGHLQYFAGTMRRCS